MTNAFPMASRPRAGAGRRWLIRAGFVVAGLVTALLLLELTMQLFWPFKTHGAARELREFREGGERIANMFMVDPDFGFRPRLGTRAYTEFGTHANGYPLAKTAGRRRVLFLGDSVTDRGGIDRALRTLCGDERFEYWNAGVSSFNTVQEVEWYRRYVARIEPDEVVLTFHLNDFEATPVAFIDDRGRLVVCAPRGPTRELNRTLFEHSHVYRMLVGMTTDRDAGQAVVRDDVRRALGELQHLVRPPARLTVLVFPFMAERSTWLPAQSRAHDDALAILAELQIRHFDLLPVLAQALRDGIDVQEDPGDQWHPSPAMAARIAEHLVAQGLLQ